MAKRTSNSEHMEQEIRVEGLWVDLTAAVKPLHTIQTLTLQEGSNSKKT